MEEKNKNKKGKNQMGLVILLTVYVILSVAGLVLFKLGASEAPFSISLAGGSFSFKIPLKSILGLCSYVISFLLYMYLVSIYDLSYIAPIGTGAAYILTMVSSYAIFKEPMTMMKIIGSIFILVGLILMNIRK